MEAVTEKVQSEVVERPQPLVAFDELERKLNAFEQENNNLVFAYDTPQGEKDARSHIFKLRQVKGNIDKIHKEAKAEILAKGRLIDQRKNTLTAKVDSYIDVHLEPIKRIEAKREAEALAKLQAEQAEKQRIENERLEAIRKQQEENNRKEQELKTKEEALKKAEADRQAQIKAEQDAAAKVEADRQAKIKADQDQLAADRAKFEAEKKAEADKQAAVEAAKLKAEQDKKDALAKAERDKAEALAKAEADKQAAVEAEKAKALAEETARILRERKRIADEKAEQERLAAIEAKRVANLKHREQIHTDIWNDIDKLLFESEKQTCALEVIHAALLIGKIRHITINY